MLAHVGVNRLATTGVLFRGVRRWEVQAPL